jgi:hypothetical protein
MRVTAWLTALGLASMMVACSGSPSDTPSTGNENVGPGITSTLVLSGALQGAVSVDNDGSSLDTGQIGCTQPDLSGEVPFGFIFQGHLPGQPIAGLEVSIAQTQSASNVADPHIKVTFPNPANAADILIADNGYQWNTATYGTLTIDLSGTTETGTVNAEVSSGPGATGAATQVGISGSWHCTTM